MRTQVLLDENPQEVRDYAHALGVADNEALAAGMAQKSGEFKRAGSEVYVPIVHARDTA